MVLFHRFHLLWLIHYFKPLQLTFVFATVDAANTAGSVMVTLEVVVQELASDTVTVYVPAVTPVMLAVVAALLHANVYGEVPPDPLAVADPSDPAITTNVLYL